VELLLFERLLELALDELELLEAELCETKEFEEAELTEALEIDSESLTRAETLLKLNIKLELARLLTSEELTNDDELDADEFPDELTLDDNDEEVEEAIDTD
jgi:hypothetical protein